MKEFDSLQLYLPSVVAKQVAETKRDEDGRWKPQGGEIETVCLFLDVAGFTSLTEKLAALGPSGLEDLALGLNKFATFCVKLINRAGGDIIKFAGDAIIAIWPEIDANDFPLRVRRAVQCALDMQLQLENFKLYVYEKDMEYKDMENGDPIFTNKIRCKLGLGKGKLRVMHLGGNGDLIQRERFEYVFLGDALTDAIESEKQAQPGDVVVSRDIWNMISKHFNAKKGVKLADKRVAVSEWKEESRVQWRAYDRKIPDNNETERKLWKYVPNAVMPYLMSENDEFWAPELRTVTTLFFDLGLDVPSMMYGKNSSQNLSVMEKVFFEIQGIVLSYEGTINKFLIDDKGSTLIAVFGLPPFAHENDPLRGILSGLKTLWMLSRYKLNAAVGITTGLAFCGIIGHARGNRREYSIIGDSINLSARLMHYAKQNRKTFLIDRVTKKCVEKNTVLGFIPIHVNLKGITDTVVCYQISSTDTLKNSPTPDYHSVQMARLSELSQNNIAILDKSKQKTRRRPTKTALNDPIDMKRIEELQVKSMVDSKFLEKRAKARNKVDNEEHDHALSLATKSFRNHSSSSGGSSGSSGDHPSLAKVRYRYHANEEAEVTISIEKVRTVRDVLITAIKTLQKKRYIQEQVDAKYYELLLVLGQGDDRITLKPSRMLSSLPFTSLTEVLTLDLIKYDRQRNYSSTNKLGYHHTAEFVRQELRDFHNQLVCGQGGKIVLLDGDHGVGKSRLVENVLLETSSSSSEFVDDVLIGYAKGNPFESGRNARPFAVWEHIMNCLLDPANTPQGRNQKHKSQAVPRKSKEQQIIDAVETANRLQSKEFLNTRDLHLLNKILLTDFPGYDDEQAIAEDEGAQQQLGKPKKSDKKKKNTLTKRGKLIQTSSVKALAMIFGGSSSSLTSAGSSESLDSVGGGGGGRFSSKRDSSRTRFSQNPRMSMQQGGGSTSRPPSSIHEMDPVIQTVVKLLAAIVGGLAQKAPIVIVVDEAHFMDSFSWTVFQAMAEKWVPKANVLTILIHRIIRIERGLTGSAGAKDEMSGNDNRVSVWMPKHAKTTTENQGLTGHSKLRSHFRGRISQFEDVESATVLQHEALKALADKYKDQANPPVVVLELRPTISDTKDIIMNFANVDKIPEPLEDFLRKKTGGNPLYITDAIQEFIDQGLIVIPKKMESEIKFPDDKFEKMLQNRALPIPLSVESIVGSMIDRMTIQQQLIIKVAAILGEVFTLEMVRKTFPTESKRDVLEEDWEELIKSGFFVRITTDQAFYKKETDKAKIQYGFGIGWMVEVLLRRMLNKQKLNLSKLKKKVRKQMDEDLKKDYMMKAQSKLGPSVVCNGYLQIQKGNPKNVLRAWKPRYCVLKGSELIQHYDEANQKRLEVIILNENSSVNTEPVPELLYESRIAGSHSGSHNSVLYCFKITTNEWEKKGKLRRDTREFKIGCNTEQDRMQWVYSVQYQIDLITLQRETTESGRGSIATHGTIDSFDHVNGSQHQRPSISTVATDDEKRKKHNKILKVFKKRSSHYGKNLLLMNADDYGAIKDSETLKIFWSSKSNAHDSPCHHIPIHDGQFFYNCRELSIVSKNSKSEIDGYLMGKLQHHRRGKVSAFVEAVAVLPTARRKGIGRKLYQKFFALCRGKACKYVRAIVHREHSIAIAFHRALGFEEDDQDTEFFSKFEEGESRVIFVKNLDFSSQEKAFYPEEQQEFEMVNPMVHK